MGKQANRTDLVLSDRDYKYRLETERAIFSNIATAIALSSIAALCWYSIGTSSTYSHAHALLLLGFVPGVFLPFFQTFGVAISVAQSKEKSVVSFIGEMVLRAFGMLVSAICLLYVYLTVQFFA